jgi:pimeloyl-ACP methyl ester carboxylesterase
LPRIDASSARHPFPETGTMDRKLRTGLALAIAITLGVWTARRAAHDAHPTARAPTAAQAAAAQAAPATGGLRPTRHLGRLAFTPCTLSAPLGTSSLEAQCATLSVPEDRAHPQGRHIDLAIAWLPASDEAAPDPVVMLAGGPGQGALESFPTIAQAFAEVRKTRHVILVDQRGTGGSNPLACKDAPGQNAAMEEQADSLAKARAFAARCAASLATRADPRFYTTGEAIDDLDAVRAAIGAPSINLVGVSYGTRVAQQYARRYAAHTRTVTLDGVVPNSLVLGNEHARNLEASLGLQFARCRAQRACAGALGDPRTQLNALLARVDVAPPLVNYRDGITGEARTERLTRDHIATLARMFAYAPQIAGLLPLELHEAMLGRYEPLMALSQLVTTTLGDSITQGMQLSVICTEDADGLAVDPRDAKSLIGTDLITVLRAQCEAWPHGTRDPQFRAPLSGNVPVLLLSGEFDPVTPPRYGEQVRAALPKARHLIVRGQGHNVLPVGCVPKLFAAFVAAADASKLDVACLEQVPYAQPFTGFYGWEP